MMLGNFALAESVTPARLFGWGDNYNGAGGWNLGETESGARKSSPVQLGSDADWLQVSGSYNFV